MLRFFLIALPVFIIVYVSAMAIIEIKDYIKKYR